MRAGAQASQDPNGTRHPSGAFSVSIDQMIESSANLSEGRRRGFAIWCFHAGEVINDESRVIGCHVSVWFPICDLIVFTQRLPPANLMSCGRIWRNWDWSPQFPDGKTEFGRERVTYLGHLAVNGRVGLFTSSPRVSAAVWWLSLGCLGCKE